MRISSRVVVLTLLTCLGPHTAGHAQTPSTVTLSSQEMEVFLTTAAIVRTRDAGTGVTDSRRATLSDGRITHDAQIQDVDVAKPVFEAGRATELNFRDTYRYNIAGYRLAKLVGLENVPMSVERRVGSKRAAITWWIDDVKVDEKGRLKAGTVGPDPERTAKQLHIMRVWDELIQNRDRNQGNILWTSDWTLWLIDHTRAFRLGAELLKPDQLTRCERSLLQRLRELTREAVTAAVGTALEKGEIEAIIRRRDVIVKHFDARIAERGEAIVLFTLER